MIKFLAEWTSATILFYGVHKGLCDLEPSDIKSSDQCYLCEVRAFWENVGS